MSKLIYLKPKTLSKGGGLVRFSLTEESAELADRWWDGEPEADLKVYRAKYKYKSPRPKVVSTGNLIYLFRDEIVKEIVDFERDAQRIEFLIDSPAGEIYGYSGIKTLYNLDIFDRESSQFGTDYSLTLLQIKASVPEFKHFYRILGIENYQFVSLSLSQHLSEMNDGSFEFGEIELVY